MPMRIEKFGESFRITSETDFQLIDLQIITEAITEDEQFYEPNIHLYDFAKYFDKHNNEWVILLTQSEYSNQETS